MIFLNPYTSCEICGKIKKRTMSAAGFSPIEVGFVAKHDKTASSKGCDFPNDKNLHRKG